MNYNNLTKDIIIEIGCMQYEYAEKDDYELKKKIFNYNYYLVKKGKFFRRKNQNKYKDRK